MVSVTHEEQLGLNSPAEPHAGDSRTQKCGDSILLVEDDMPTLRLERVILEEAGYLVEGVACGEAALELIADEPPALVILDNGLPGMDGFTTCRRIREFSRVPVLMISGGKTTANRKQATASGANGYITKPFPTGKLVDLAAEIIAESAGYFYEGQGEGEGSQPVDKSLSNSQLPEEDNAPAPSASVLDARDPIGESASLSAEDRNQPDGDQPIDSPLSWRNEDSPARVLDPVDEEEPEDDPTERKLPWSGIPNIPRNSSLPWKILTPKIHCPGTVASLNIPGRVIQDRILINQLRPPRWLGTRGRLQQLPPWRSNLTDLPIRKSMIPHFRRRPFPPKTWPRMFTKTQSRRMSRLKNRQPSRRRIWMRSCTRVRCGSGSPHPVRSRTCLLLWANCVRTPNSVCSAW